MRTRQRPSFADADPLNTCRNSLPQSRSGHFAGCLPQRISTCAQRATCTLCLCCNYKHMGYLKGREGDGAAVIRQPLERQSRLVLIPSPLVPPFWEHCKRWRQKHVSLWQQGLAWHAPGGVARPVGMCCNCSSQGLWRAPVVVRYPLSLVFCLPIAGQVACACFKWELLLLGV